MERFYSIAGVNFRVSGQAEELYREDGVLAPFRTGPKSGCHDIELELTDQLLPPEGECVFTGFGKKVFAHDHIQMRYEGVHGENWDNVYLRIAREAGVSRVQAKRSAIAERINPKCVLTAMELEHQIVKNHGILFHSAYIRWDDEAILFTAPSGIGKSTQAELWCRLRGAELINGDRSAVMIGNGRAVVYGVPYSGSSGVSQNKTLPLRAIVYLSQTPKTELSTLRGLKAFMRIWEGCSVNVWSREDMDLCTRTVTEIAGKVPVFHLACTPDESAVIALEEELKKLR